MLGLGGEMGLPPALLVGSCEVLGLKPGRSLDPGEVGFRSGRLAVG